MDNKKYFHKFNEKPDDKPSDTVKQRVQLINKDGQIDERAFEFI